MRSLNASELENYLAWLEPRVLGAQLQEVVCAEADLFALKFFRVGTGTFSLWFDLKIVEPHLIWLPSDVSFPFKKRQRPVGLFLNANAKNLYVDAIYLEKDLGRVVRIELRNQQRSCLIRFVLIPRLPNVLVESQGKEISWFKPQELRPGGVSPPAEITDWDNHWTAYLADREAAREKSPGTTKHPAKDTGRALSKKKAALQAMARALAEQSEVVEGKWRVFGERLKVERGPGSEDQELWQSSLDLAGNINRAFAKAKEIARKRASTIERMAALEREIEQLESPEAHAKESKSPTVAAGNPAEMLQKSSIRARTLRLSSGAYAMIGKSGKDNLALLRKARAWDYWLHAHHQPSAHAIIFRNRDQNIAQAEIDEVSRWLARQTRIQGDRCEMLIVECRFVRPIKGDHHGRVNYHSHRVFTVALQSASST